MSTATATPEKTHNSMQKDRYWEQGRVVVHTAGTDAGLIRLDMEFPEISSAEEAEELVKLVIPGELSPLNATGATGENGRFVISFFSSDIANAGHLPAEAVACWNMDGHENQTKPVDVQAAEVVLHRQGEEAANVPGGKPATRYPETVVMLVVLTVGILMACVVGFLVAA